MLTFFFKKRNRYMSTLEYLSKVIYKIGNSTDEKSKKLLQSLINGSILINTSKPLNKYRKEAIRNNRKKNKKKLLQLALLVDLYSDLADKIGNAWEKSSNKEITKFRINATMKLLFKSIQTCFDMLTLFENGSLVPTYVLWRMLYENYIISKFLLNSEDSLSERYNDYEWIEYQKLLRKNAENNVNETVNKIINWYGKEFKRSYGWANINKDDNLNTLANIIDKVGGGKFHIFYNFSSKIIHSTSISVNRDIFHNERYGNTDMIGIYDQIEIPYKITITLMQEYFELMINFFYDDDDTDKIICKETLSILTELITGNIE